MEYCLPRFVLFRKNTPERSELSCKVRMTRCGDNRNFPSEMLDIKWYRTYRRFSTSQWNIPIEEHNRKRVLLDTRLSISDGCSCGYTNSPFRKEDVYKLSVQWIIFDMQNMEITFVYFHVLSP
jgi:hypothetical protein